MPVGTGYNFSRATGPAPICLRGTKLDGLILRIMAVVGLAGGVNAPSQNNPVWADNQSSVTLGSATTDADEADRSVIAQLKAQGSDTTKPTDVIFYLIFPTQAHAEALRDSISAMGFNVDIHKLDGYSEWTLAANKTLVPSETNILPLSHKFEAMALSEDGEYDGWEAALLK